MSNLGRRQLGVCEKAFKYEFTLEILRFFCKVPVPCKLKFMWKRNNKSIETKGELDMRPSTNELPVNEKLSSISTIIFNTERREFLPKESELIANMLFGGSPKRLASAHIDMRRILDPNAHRAPRSEVLDLPMTLHVASDMECRVNVRLSSVYKQEMVCSDRSVGNGSLNMSGLSIPQDGRYFEKRYEVVPSKDNKDSHSVIAKDSQSVNSYNPNRYPSAKRERDDGSIRKFDYGYLAALKSNLSNNNENDGRSNKKSLDNKTETNEVYNRQLADEQNRRSKAEAELTKNRMEIEGLKQKLGELTIENAQLKMGAGDTNAFQQRIYELSNDLKIARAQIDAAGTEIQRAEAQIKAARSEKGMLESELQKKQKRLEGLEAGYRSLEGAQGEAADLKYQVESLRRAVDENRRQMQQRENQLLTDKFREGQQANARLEAARRENEKLRATAGSNQLLQKRISEAEGQLKEKLSELSTKTRYIIDVEREMEEYKNRLAQYETEKVFMQREIIKLKHDGGARNDLEQQRMEALRAESTRLQEQLAAAQFNADQRQRTILKLEQERANNESKSNRLLLQANQAQKHLTELQTECRALRQRASKLEQANAELAEEAGRLREEGAKQMAASGSSSPQAERLFRESLQLQVQLKFAKDELERLRGVEEALEQEKWRADREGQQRLAAESELERAEKQLAGKNRALMIEVQKTKMMSQQINELHYNCELLREELEKNRSIIHNGQQQLTALESSLQQLEAIKHTLEGENAQLNAEKLRLTTNNEEARQLQVKVKQLEERNAEKLASLQASNHNLLLAHRQAKESQKLAQQRLQALAFREKQLSELETRLRQAEQSRAALESETMRAGQERRLVQKRMQVVMEEMHSMKKRYEDEKGRSVSFTRNEDLHRLRSMEGELEKKEKAVSRLSKEKLELEEENVKMNVQIMKLLSELQKYKATSNPHSLKLITHSLK